MQVRVLPVRPEQSGKTDTTNQDIPGFFLTGVFMRKLASIRKIAGVRPIPEADAIECVVSCEAGM